MVKKKAVDLSVPELKAYAYDLIVSREQTTNELQLVNQAIAKKSLEEKANPKKPVDETPVEAEVPVTE